MTREVMQQALEALENDNTVFKWNRAELIEIKRYYKELSKAMEATA